MGIAAGIESTGDNQHCVLLVCGTTTAQLPPEYARLLGTQLIMLADYAVQSNVDGRRSGGGYHSHGGGGGGGGCGSRGGAGYRKPNGKCAGRNE